MTFRVLYSAVLVTISSPVFAAEGDPLLTENILPVVLNLGLVVVAILALAWLLRRSPLAGKSNGQLSVMSTLALGQRERLVLVQFGGRKLLLGINGQSITLLSEAGDFLGDSEPAETSGSFETLMESKTP